MGGGPIDVSQWINESNAIIEGWYPGMECGNALAKVIFGEVNPSGKLPMTFPKKLEDSPEHKLGEFIGINGNVHYNEGIFVGYRYFDTYKVEPQFAFGHGLSYTTFQYSNITMQRLPGKNVIVNVTVKNTGKIAGTEVVELYVKEEKPLIERPEKELKAFAKVFINPGESKKLTLNLDALSFAYYDEQKKCWVANSGKYILMAGSSSRDIRLSKILMLQ